MMSRSIAWVFGLIFMVEAVAAAAGDLPLTAELDNSKGLKSGDHVLFEGRQIGEVTAVGFGERDIVEVSLTIDAKHRDLIRKNGLFVVNEAVHGQRPAIEYFVIDANSPPAAANGRIPGARSLADVWLRRGRISAGELSRATTQGVDQLRRNLEELRRSPEWGKFKDQVAKLSAQLTVTGEELTRLLNDQLPKLQKELDDLYVEYQRDLERSRRTPAP